MVVFTITLFRGASINKVFSNGFNNLTTTPTYTFANWEKGGNRSTYQLLTNCSSAKCNITCTVYIIQQRLISRTIQI